VNVEAQLGVETEEKQALVLQLGCVLAQTGSFDRTVEAQFAESVRDYAAPKKIFSLYVNESVQRKLLL